MMKVKETCLSRGCFLQPRKIEAVFGVPLDGAGGTMECDRSTSHRQAVQRTLVPIDTVQRRADHQKAGQKGFCGIILLKSSVSSFCLPSKLESGGLATKYSFSSIVELFESHTHAF